MSFKPQTKQGYVYNVLREDIQNGRLKPGTKLTLAELQERFEVSHIPIREALRNLEKESLVELSPHATAVVKGISTQEAIWLGELRIILEPLAAAQATQHLCDGDLTELGNLIAQMDKEVDNANLSGYLQLNFELHKLIYSHTPNQHLARIVNELVETINRYHMTEGQLQLWHNEHKKLFQALKKKDETKVQEIMHQHLLHMNEIFDEEKGTTPEDLTKEKTRMVTKSGLFD